MRLKLFSNSTMPGESYLAWALPYLRDHLEGIEEILFVPFAGVTIDYDTYTQNVARALPEKRVLGLHTVADKIGAVQQSSAIVVGGGNTFALLYRCQQEGLLPVIASAVRGGVPYAGWSAGANLACPTIKTTNDMPIIATDGLEALSLVPFQINPHFTEKTIAGHGGESRIQRLREYLARNPALPVLGLPEGMLIDVQGDEIQLRGAGEACILRGAGEPEYLPAGPVTITG